MVESSASRVQAQHFDTSFRLAKRGPTFLPFDPRPILSFIREADSLWEANFIWTG